MNWGVVIWGNAAFLAGYLVGYILGHRRGARWTLARITPAVDRLARTSAALRAFDRAAGAAPQGGSDGKA